MPKFIGFAPDLDTTVEGVVLDCESMVPSIRGMKAAASAVSVGMPALADAALGGATLVKLDNTKRLVVGTAKDLYEQNNGEWTKVTRSSKTYDTSAEGVWRFAQFGNATVAANHADVLQQSVVGQFSDIPDAPKAAVVESVAGFVFAFNTSDPKYGVRQDAWWCSGLYDHTIWKPSQATQCATARLVDTPGDIRAGRAFGSDIVVYKESSMYYGTFQGPPVIWAFNVIANQIGAPCQEAVVSIGTAHLFLGNDNFYIFDGTRPQPIGDGLKKWFFADQNPKYRHRVRSVHDHSNSLVCWYYVGHTSSGALDSCVVYNYKTAQWGRANREMECAVELIDGQVSWAGLGKVAPQWKDMPNIPWNSSYWTSVALHPSIIDAKHTIRTLTGVAGRSSLTTGDFGDDEQYTLLQHLRLRCAQNPDGAQMRTQHRATLGGLATLGPESDFSDGKFDVDVSDRFHRAIFTMHGDCELIGFTPRLIPDGYA